MQRQTLRDWVHRDNAEGVSGLLDRPQPKPRRLLSSKRLAEFDRIIDAGPNVAVDGIVRWRRIGLKQVIERRFGVVMAERTVGTCCTSGASFTCRCGRAIHAATRPALLQRSVDWPRERPWACGLQPSDLGCPVPFKANADRRHRIARQRFKVTNWRDYGASLRGRGSLTVWFTDEAILSWTADTQTTRGGQQTYSGMAVLTALTLRTVFRLALRQTEGLIGCVMRLLGLDLAVPDHSTLSRRAATVEVPRPRACSGVGPLHLLVDSTGLKLCGAGEWLNERHGTRVRRPWRKLHFGVDAATARIVASLLTAKDVDDGSQVGPLLDRVEEPLASVTGDGAYDQEGVTASIGSRDPHAAIIVPPRSTAVPSEASKTAPRNATATFAHRRARPHGLAGGLRLH